MSGWSTDDIPDQTGRIVVITGANSGIGYVAARELARHGARVILACRDAGRGEEALNRLRAEVPGGQAEVRALDLADLASVERFCDELHGELDHLDVLVNNAGVMATPRRTTADGFELQFGTNHLGHFALTAGLMDLLLAAPEPRVVTLSSTAHKIGRMRFDDLQGERRYERWSAYGQSKLANLLFMRELARRAEQAGSALVSVAAHPGYAATNLQAVGPRMRGNPVEGWIVGLGNRLFAQSSEMGALPTLYAATMPDLRSGDFVGPDGIFEMRGRPRLTQPRPSARDDTAAARLWEASERLTGRTIDFSLAARPGT